MEEPELEEGEACYYKDDTSIDPDIALSYIDEKLQSVLGHYQKDFEGGVSAENLGAKFGGYGSFLPTHQRSPSIWSQPKTPPRVQNHGMPRSPSNLPLEDVPQNIFTASNSSLPPRFGSATCGISSFKDTIGDVLAKQNSSLSSVTLADNYFFKQNPSSTKLDNPTGQRTLKVRIKVNSDNLKRNNAAIYSGLGLMSPSSSTGNSAEESGGVPFESEEAGESPASILQIMASFPVSGGLLLSPLQDGFLCLTRKENISEGGGTTAFKCRQEGSAMLPDNSVSIKANEKVSEGKQTKPLGKNEIMEGSKHGKDSIEDGMASNLKKKIGLEMLESKHCPSLDMKPKLLSNAVINSGDSLRFTVNREIEKDVPVKKRDVNRNRFGERPVPSNLVEENLLEYIFGLDDDKYEQHGNKSSLVEKSGEQVINPLKVSSADLKETGRSIDDRVPAPHKAESDTSKNEMGSGAMKHGKQNLGAKASQHEQNSKRLPQNAKVSSEGRKKSIGSQNNGNQKNALKVRDSCKDLLNTMVEYVENQMDPSERLSGDSVKDSNYKTLKVQQTVFNKSRERSSCKKVDKQSTSEMVIKEPSKDGLPSSNLLSSQIEVAPVAPVYIAEDWVCCDRCQKWRLLPYGTKPDQLPEKWLCSMLNWLPGMNRCDISEDETTRALEALYQLPVPETQNNLPNHTNSAAFEVTTADGWMDKSMPQNHGKLCNITAGKYGDQQREKRAMGGKTKPKKLKNKRDSDQRGCGVKKKIKIEGTLATDQNSEHDVDVGRTGLVSSAGFPITRTGLDMQKHSPPKNKNFESKDRLLISVKKQGGSTQLSLESKSDAKTHDGRNMGAKKRKQEDWPGTHNYVETLRGDGNDLAESKVCLKEENNDSEFRTEKKLKVCRVDWKESSTSKCDDRANKGRVTRILLSNGRDNPLDGSVKKEQQPRKYRVKVASKLTLDDIDSLKRDLRCEQFSMTATSSSSKVSDSRKSRSHCQEVKGSPVESVSSSPLRAFKLDKLSLMSSDKLGKDEENNDEFSFMENPRNLISGDENLEKKRSGAARNKKSSGIPHIDGDARHKFSEQTDLSVRTVSVSGNGCTTNSDPLGLERASVHPNDMHALGQSLSGDMHKKWKKSVKGSTSQCKDKGRSSVDSSGRVMEKFSESLIEQNDVIQNNCMRDEAEIGPHCERLGETRHHVPDQFGSKPVKDVKNGGKKVSKKLANDNRKEFPSKLGNQDVSDVKMGAIASICDRDTPQRNPIKNFETEMAKRSDATRVESRGGKSKFDSDLEVNQGLLPQSQQIYHGTLRGNCLNRQSVDASGVVDVPKVVKQPRNGAQRNAELPLRDRCEVSDRFTPNHVKKDGTSQAASCVLKEAENLKGCADRIKDSGFSFECNEAYFQAALKFLQGASLLETCNTESGKQGEMAQIQIYNSTAKLCEMCALEYEKRQEMAAAALAYKCMEVAYMRVIYCKNSSTIRDRNDLQANLQMVPQGESPSSSASDIDNLNNQTTIDKASLSKGMNSHTGNPFLAARNRPNFTRLLDFTRDVNSAMEASRKSHNAFSAANVIVEEAENREDIVSVKRVIDFSFQDVDELVRMVRLAIEAISHQGLCGRA